MGIIDKIIHFNITLMISLNSYMNYLKVSHHRTSKYLATINKMNIFNGDKSFKI